MATTYEQMRKQMNSLACTGCTAKTPNIFDSRGDTSIRVRHSKSTDGIIRREVLCDWCAARDQYLID